MGSRTNTSMASSGTSASMAKRTNSDTSSSLNQSLRHISDKIFDNTSFDNFSQQFGLVRKASSLRKQRTSDGNETISEISDSNASVENNSDTDQANQSLASNVTLSLLNLEANDFPDVCIRCESCMH